MTHRIGLALLDTLLAVETTDRGTATEVRRLWAPFVRPVPLDTPTTTLTPGAGTWTLRGPQGPTVTVGSAGEALTALATAVNRQVLDEVSGFAVHAAVVRVGQACAAFVGPSGTGKSTLTAALLSVGAGYVSDEALVIRRDDGAVVPYPRPLGLSAWSRHAVGLPAVESSSPEALVAPDEVGSVHAGPPGPLTHLVALLPADGGPARTGPLPRQEAGAMVLRHSFNHWRDPSSSFQVAHRLAADATTLRLRLGPPDQTARWMCALLGDQDAADTHVR